jgi:hypothetical protein
VEHEEWSYRAQDVLGNMGHMECKKRPQDESETVDEAMKALRSTNDGNVAIVEIDLLRYKLCFHSNSEARSLIGSARTHEALEGDDERVQSLVLKLGKPKRASVVSPKALWTLG